MPDVAGTLSLKLAQAIADAACDAAAARGQAQLAVVVTDAGGDLRAGLRSEGQGAFAFDIAHAKARSALGFRMSTARLAGLFGGNAVSTLAIAGATGGRFVPMAGGVVVTDAVGQLLGAAAVAGGTPQTDDELVRQAVLATGLQVLA